MTAFAGPKQLSPIVGTPDFFDGEVDSDPGNEQTLLTFSVPAGTKRNLHSLNVNSSMPGWFKVFDGSTLIGSGKLGPAQENVPFLWIPGRAMDAGAVFTLQYKQITNGPIVPVRYHLMVADEDV